jgi:hypothetical protein
MKAISLLFCILLFGNNIDAKDRDPDFYQIKVYHLKNNDQVAATEQYLENVCLPALHRLGIKNIGVFKPVNNDTASEKLIYVLIPVTNINAWTKIDGQLEQDRVYQSAAKSFLNSDAKNPSYARMESILLKAFPGQPHLMLPKQKKQERVFELRSYESPTESLFRKKMAMFNNGEIEIFSRLGFNPVFYAEVISGSRMPNLMYMPVFKSVEERNAQWKKFGADTAWKRISAISENQNDVSVSHIDSIIMHSTNYSDY